MANRNQPPRNQTGRQLPSIAASTPKSNEHSRTKRKRFQLLLAPEKGQKVSMLPRRRDLPEHHGLPIVRCPTLHATTAHATLRRLRWLLPGRPPFTRGSQQLDEMLIVSIWVPPFLQPFKLLFCSFAPTHKHTALRETPRFARPRTSALRERHQAQPLYASAHGHH
jgi:hypothetical protein